MSIEYAVNEAVTPEEVIELYRAAGLRRPLDDPARIARMYAHSNLIITARHDGRLVGVARALADFAHACYLADLAVHPDVQGQGIGRELIDRVRAEATPESILLLLSAPGAMTYYPHVGMERVENGFLFPRER